MRSNGERTLFESFRVVRRTIEGNPHINGMIRSSINKNEDRIRDHYLKHGDLSDLKIMHIGDRTKFTLEILLGSATLEDALNTLREQQALSYEKIGLNALNGVGGVNPIAGV